MSLGSEKEAVFLGLVYIHVLRMVESQLAFVDAVTNCVYRQRILEVFLSPCSNVHYRIMSVFNAVPSKGHPVFVFGFVPCLKRSFWILLIF